MFINAKALISSKTFWIAVAQALVGIYIALTTQYPTIATVGWLAIGKSLLDIFLRYMTTTPIGGITVGGRVLQK